MAAVIRARSWNTAVVQQRPGGGQGSLRTSVRRGQPYALRRQLVPQHVLAQQLLRSLQHRVRVVGAIERPEEIARPRHGNGRLFAVVTSLAGQVGQQPIGLSTAPGGGERASERELGTKPRTSLHRRSCQPLGEHRVGHGQRARCRAGEQRDIPGRTGLEPGRGDPQQVPAAPCPARLHGVGELRVEGLEARRRQPSAHRLPVQGMADVDEPPPSVRAAIHEFAAFQLLQGVRRAVNEQSQLQRTAHRDELEQIASTRADAE